MTFCGYVLRTVALCAAISLSAQNSLENGSFEFSPQDPGDSVRSYNPGSNGLESWTIGGGNVTYVGTLLTAAEGSRSVYLRTTPTWVEQKIATPAGQQYRVYYDVSAYVFTSANKIVRGKATITSATGSILATQNFEFDANGKTFPNPGWSPFTFDFTADSTNITARFETSDTVSPGPVIDNVRIVPGRDVGGVWTSDGALVWKTRLPRTMSTTIGATHFFAPEILGAGPITYQWYKRTSSSYNIINGATSATYTLTPIASNSGAVYRVVATSSLNSITNETTLLVVRPPQFATEPREVRVSVGSQLSTPNVSFSGSAPDTYQWFKNNQPIVGATNSFYSKPSAELTDAGDYYLHVANIAGETNSVTFPVVVVEGPVPPWFRPSNQPQPNVAVELGTSLSLFASAEGAQPLTYYWFKDGQQIPDVSGNSYFKNTTTDADSGTYSLMASNSVATAMSSNAVVIVYPQQQFPVFANSDFRTNAAAGAPFALTFALTQGSHLSFQWYKRLLSDPIGRGNPVPGATAQTLNFPNLSLDDAAQYTLVATNFKGSAEKAIELNVLAPPVFSSAPQGYEGPAFGPVNMSANIQNWSSSLTYQWYRNGVLIPNATGSSYNFAASDQTVGTYTVVAKNEAGETTSPPATVSLRALTPADGTFLLVADNTVTVPGREPARFTTVGDATINDQVVTFQSVTNVNDPGGLYKWTAPSNITKIVDLHTMLPTFSALSTNFDGVSIDDSGKISFIAGQPENAEHAVFQWEAGAYTALATHQTDMPGRPGLKFGRFGYPSRSNGKTAFLGMETVSAGYRGVFVSDGAALTVWASSDQPLPAGNGFWSGNSAQLAFDGTTAAFWAVDGNNANGIFKTVNAGPMEKIAFTGDAIPGGLGTFKGFNSPPRVTDGKVLFLAQANERTGNLLLEHSALGLRVIAKSGDAPTGAGALSVINYSFKHGAGGDILFSASGPGQKQGIYRWNNGVINEALTTLNTLNGRTMRFLSLYDADGDDAVITVSFNGSQYALYATVGNNGQTGPEISFTVSGRNVTLTWGPGATLQESTDLVNWTNVLNASSPKTISATESTIKFYRLLQ